MRNTAVRPYIQFRLFLGTIQVHYNLHQNKLRVETKQFPDSFLSYLQKILIQKVRSPAREKTD